MSFHLQDPEFYDPLDPFGRDDLASEPPSRGHARPSLSELNLIRYERRKIVPSMPPPPAPISPPDGVKNGAAYTAALCDRKVAEACNALY